MNTPVFVTDADCIVCEAENSILYTFREKSLLNWLI